MRVRRLLADHAYVDNYLYPERPLCQEYSQFWEAQLSPYTFCFLPKELLGGEPNCR